jgi:ABC-type nitrate/sulfonate/bicarbonate transport system substrate-binding protein
MAKGELTVSSKLRAVVSSSAAALCATLVIAGCGSGGAEPSSSETSGKLTVALGSTNSDINNFIALEKGYFKAQGLHVDLQADAGANTTSLVASGQADIAAYAITTPLVVAGKGQAVKVIYGTTGAGTSGMLAAGPEIKSIEQLKTVHGCKIGSFPPGSVVWAYTNMLINDVPLDCEAVPFQNAAAISGALVSGRVQAVVGSVPFFSSLIDDGKAHWLINTFADPSLTKKYYGPPIPEGAVWGMADNLRSKKELIVRYLKALAQARAFVKDKANTDEVTKILASQPSFSGMTEDQVRKNVTEINQVYQYAWGHGDGRITNEQWDAVLKVAGSGAVPGYKAGEKAFSYPSMVDMSYLDQALASR